MVTRFLLALSLAGLPLLAQSQLAGNPKQRIKVIRDLEKEGSLALPKIKAYLSDPDPDVRVEAVKAIAEIGTGDCLDPLIQGTRDNDPEVQVYATDGLVNFYLPGYLKTGFSGTISRVGTAIKGKFSDTNDQVIASFIQVRPDVIQALGKLVSGGVSMDVRANAARAVGILRGRGAVDDLVAALRTKDDEVMYESLVALQKIRDPSAGPRIEFVLHDPDDKVQMAAIDTTALLGNKDALPELRDVLQNARNDKIRRSALNAIAMLPDPANRPLFDRYFDSRDDQMRAAADEGLGRLQTESDQPRLAKAFADESKMKPRLALAFALVMLGNHSMSEFSPLRYLVDTLNSKSYQGIAFAYLVELARDKTVREALYPALGPGTKDEKIQLGQVFARSGDSESVSYLDALSKDTDPDVAQAGLDSWRALNARLRQ